MTTVWFWVDSEDKIAAYAALGHAGYADPGEDIVCAGVSALTQAAANGLEAVAGLVPLVTVQPGWLYVRVPQGRNARRRRDAQVILQTLAQGLSDMAQAYPEHIRLIWKEKRCEA